VVMRLSCPAVKRGVNPHTATERANMGSVAQTRRAGADHTHAEKQASIRHARSGLLRGTERAWWRWWWEDGLVRTHRVVGLIPDSLNFGKVRVG
jgi:hypothetical protein